MATLESISVKTKYEGSGVILLGLLLAFKVMTGAGWLHGQDKVAVLSVVSEGEGNGSESVPVKGAEVSITNRSSLLPDKVLMTDESGKVEIPVKGGENQNRFDVKISKDGLFIPKFQYNGGIVPKEVKVTMSRIQYLEGQLLIEDEEIQARDIRVRSRYLKAWNTRPFRPVDQFIDEEWISADGKFRIAIPNNPESATTLIISGEEIQTEYFFLGHNVGHKKSRLIEKVDEYDWRVPVKRAAKIYGVMRSKGGDGIGGMNLQAVPTASDFYSLGITTEISSTVSNADGDYSVYLNFPGNHRVDVWKDGLYTQQRVISNSKGDREIDFEFPDPVKLSGRVINMSGEPLEGVHLSVMFVNNSPKAKSKATYSDADGAFSLDLVPGGKIVLSAGRKNARNREHITIDSTEESSEGIIIRMPEMFELDLTVIDADSRRPVEGLEVYKGTGWNAMSGRVDRWQKYVTDPIENGRIKNKPMQVLEKAQGHRFIIWAPGYQPYDSGFVSGASKFQKTIELKKRRNVTGVIVDAEGNPVEACTVFASGIGVQTLILNGTVNLYQTVTGKTDKNGKFSIPLKISGGYITAISEIGFARFKPGGEENDIAIQLKPFNTLAGILKKSDGSPWPGQTVSLHPVGRDSVHDLIIGPLFNNQVTGEDGSFSFSGVPSIEVTLARIGKPQAGYMTKGISLSLNGGSHLGGNLELGGRGFHVTGKIQFPEGTEPDFSQIESIAMLRGVPPQAPEKIRSNEKLFNLWKRSKKYKAQLESLQTRVGLVDGDGDLSFHNVPDGKYHLVISLKKINMVNGRKVLRHLANITDEVEIKPGLFQSSDTQTHSLGILKP